MRLSWFGLRSRFLRSIGSSSRLAPQLIFDACLSHGILLIQREDSSDKIKSTQVHPDVLYRGDDFRDQKTRKFARNFVIKLPIALHQQAFRSSSVQPCFSLLIQSESCELRIYLSFHFPQNSRSANASKWAIIEPKLQTSFSNAYLVWLWVKWWEINDFWSTVAKSAKKHRE